MKLKRTLAALLTACLLFSLVPFATAEDAPVPLTIIRQTDTLIEDLNTNLTTLAIEEEFNVDLKIVEYPSQDAAAKLAVVMASGSELPDIINMNSLGSSTEWNYASRGLLLPLNDYLDNPEMTKNLDSRVDAETKEKIFAAVRLPDGKNYGLPSYTDEMWGRAPYRAWINTEWLDALGMEIPKTTEEFREVLKAFISQDPNGNGQADEIGLLGSVSGNDQNIMVFLLNAFTYADPGWNYLAVKDGKIYASFALDEFRDGLEYIRGLVEDGLVYPGSFTQDQTQMRAIINQDGDYVVGVVTAGSAGHWSGVSSNPNLRKMTMLEPLTGPQGECNTPTSEPGIVNRWYITTACEYPELAFAIGEHFYDFETSFTQRYGVKEQDWTTDPEKMAKYFYEYDPNDEHVDQHIFAIMNDAAWTNVNNVNWRNSTPYIFDHAKDLSWAIETKENVENGSVLVFRPNHYERYVPHMADEVIGSLIYTEEELERIGELWGDIFSPVNEGMTAVVTGNRSLDEWDSIVATANAMGLEELMSIVQAAYDRKIGG